MSDHKACRRWAGRIHRRQFVLGLSLVGLSFLMPVFFHVSSFAVLPALNKALRSGENTDLILAALRLVALNSLRGIPHYVGAFFIGTSIELRRGGRPVWAINAALMLLILYAAYRGVDAIHGVRYHFGIPAMAVSCLILLFGKLDHHYIAPVKKVLQIILFLTAFQFLDIMPIANRLPVGRGETSLDIKMAATLLNGEAILNVLGGAGSLMLCLFGMLIFLQLRDENSLRKLAVLQKQNEEIRTKARIKEIENRTFQEMQHLVHDLKSPLTAMQTLVGLLNMRAQAEGNTQDAEYLTRIESGIMQISRMISEILYEDQRTEIGTQELLDMVLAQISVTPYAEYLHAENRAPGARVSVNRFLFPRAIINLTQNSANAIPDGRVPRIELTVDEAPGAQGPRICFRVSDNGRGIRSEQQGRIWDRNVSLSSSSGLGLAFVRSVVDKLDGELELVSTPNVGTSIQILLPKEGEPCTGSQ